MIPIIILAIENDDDREFMTALYMQYHSLMYKLIFDIVKSPWDTEDILQEVLWEQLSKTGYNLYEAYKYPYHHPRE